MSTQSVQSRRAFLSGMAALGLSGLTGCGGGGDGVTTHFGVNMGGTGLPAPGVNGGGALRIPLMLSGNNLSAAAGNYDLGGGARAGAMLYNGLWPSPTIRIAAGGTLDFTLHNQLNEPTNIHWHGLAAAPGMDGHPMEVVATGATRRYQFPVFERPGTYWYHPHPHQATARQAYSGLAGLLIVDDGNDAQRGLPTGVRDIPLVLADKRVSNGALVYQPSVMDMMTGWMGNVLTVNGMAGPVTANVEAAVIRLRLLNASNTRILNPALADGARFWLIGTDGGLLAAPVAVTSVLLAPGERIEVLLDLRGDAGRRVRFISAAFAAMGNGMMNGGMMGAQPFAPPHGNAFDMVELVVAAAGGNPGGIPAVFVPIARLDPAASSVSRVFELTELNGMMSGQHRINGLVYEPARIDFVVRRGIQERWQFINRGMEPHPMHVHGTHFQVLSRDGHESLRLATDFGWKDTVLVRPFESVEIALRFVVAANYVLHCHNLEHEDDGMMLNFNVV